MSIGTGELLLILVIVFVLFGAGKLKKRSLKKLTRAKNNTRGSTKNNHNSSN